jgi:hypothetical protein
LARPASVEKGETINTREVGEVQTHRAVDEKIWDLGQNSDMNSVENLWETLLRKGER